MFRLLRQIIAPLLSLMFLILASGLYNTFSSIRLELEGFTPDTIGWITSVLYLGILLGSLYLVKWIERWGYRFSLSLFALVSVFLIIGQSFWIDPYFWAATRLFGGIATAGIFIVIESWMLVESPPNMRGLSLALYLGVLYGSLSLGQFLINVADPQTIYPFWITAALCLASMLPIFFNKHAPKIEASTRLSITELFRISPIGFLGGVISGMLLAAVYALVPVYGKKLGLEVSEIGSLMAVIIFGGLAFQWPVARWADRGNRRRALNSSCFAAAFLGITIAAIETPSAPLLFILCWLFGGFSFAIYPLSMAYVCEKVDKTQLIAATGGFVLSYGIGAIAGPLLAPFAMDLLGNSGLFYFLAMITLILGLLGLKKSKTVS